MIWGPKYSSVKLKALCREDFSVNIIFWEENQKLWLCLLTSFQGVFGISGSLLFLHSISIPPTSPVSLWLISIGLVVASGPGTFYSQVGGLIHTRHASPKWWSSGHSHSEIWVSIPEMGTAAGTRGGKGAQELKVIPLCSHLHVLDRSSYFMPINNCTGSTAKIPCQKNHYLLPVE